MVNSHVTVLSARGVSRARGMDSDGVKRTEVATDTTDFVLEDLVVEAGFEFTLSGGGGGDVHGGLTTAENDEVFARGDGGGVEGGICDVGFEELQVSCRNDLRREM